MNELERLQQENKKLQELQLLTNDCNYRQQKEYLQQRQIEAMNKIMGLLIVH